MSISWTKYWGPSDDGTIVRGLDLKNIQDDIDAAIGNATKIHGRLIVEPGITVDGKALFWDNSNNVFDYKMFLDLTTNQSAAGIKTFTGQVRWSKGTDVASSSTTTLGDDGNSFDITGTTNITNITAKPAGTIVSLQFDAVLTVVDGGNLKLAGDFLTSAEATLTLRSDGTNWFEISRSPTIVTQFRLFESDATFIVPPNITKLYVTLVGGGGGGGGATSDGAGGGGGGESIISFPYTVTPGQSCAIVVGDGGLGGSNQSDNGVNGEASSFDGVLTVSGGVGGTSSGGGGAGSSGASANSMNASGATGGTFYSFAGGNGAGKTGSSGGGGGGSFFGTGGSGVSANNGNPGTGYGSGGAGGGLESAVDHHGGNGAKGVCIITF